MIAPSYEDISEKRRRKSRKRTVKVLPWRPSTKGAEQARGTTGPCKVLPWRIGDDALSYCARINDQVTYLMERKLGQLCLLGGINTAFKEE
jgi:hypothetical protein